MQVSTGTRTIVAGGRRKDLHLSNKKYDVTSSSGIDTIKDVNFLDARLYSGLEGEYLGGSREVAGRLELGGGAGRLVLAGDEGVAGSGFAAWVLDELANLGDGVTGASAGMAGDLAGEATLPTGPLMGSVALGDPEGWLGLLLAVASFAVLGFEAARTLDAFAATPEGAASGAFFIAGAIGLLVDALRVLPRADTDAAASGTASDVPTVFFLGFVEAVAEPLVLILAFCTLARSSPTTADFLVCGFELAVAYPWPRPACRICLPRDGGVPHACWQRTHRPKVRTD